MISLSRRFLHETGLALLFGLIMGAIVRYGVTDLGAGPNIMTVKPHFHKTVNGSQVGLPDIVLLEAYGKARETLMNKTLAYTFKGEVKDIDNINQVCVKGMIFSLKKVLIHKVIFSYMIRFKILK